MKKFLGLFLALLMVVALVSCGNKTDGTEPTETTGGEQVGGDSGVTYDEKGNKTKELVYDEAGTLVGWYEWTYDERGNQTSVIYCDAMGLVESWEEYEYDENDRLVKSEVLDSKGVVQTYSIYEYDEEDKCVKSEIYDSNGVVQNSGEYEYDENGRLVKFISYDVLGHISEWIEYEYHDDGTQTQRMYRADGAIIGMHSYTAERYLIKSTYYDYRNEDGSLSGISVWEYDDGGLRNIISTQYNSDGSIAGGEEIEFNKNGGRKHLRYDNKTEKSQDSEYFEYNDNGELIKESRISDGFLESEREVTYNNQGIKRVVYTTYALDGSIKRSEYEEDMNGVQLSYNYYYWDESRQSHIWTLTEYEKGETVRETHYNLDGSISHVVEYENGKKIRVTYSDGSFSIYEYNGNMRKLTAYNQDGIISCVEEYENDLLVKETSYNQDGLVSSIGEYGHIDGGRYYIGGISYTYNPDGSINDITEYREGTTKYSQYYNGGNLIVGGYLDSEDFPGDYNWFLDIAVYRDGNLFYSVEAESDEIIMKCMIPANLSFWGCDCWEYRIIKRKEGGSRDGIWISFDGVILAYQEGNKTYDLVKNEVYETPESGFVTY